MISHLLFMLSAGFLIIALHPFTFYPLSLKILSYVHRQPLRLPATDTQPTVALCLCAYNEERVIRAKVENMLAMRQAVPHLQIRIYVDAASDGTAKILSEYHDRIHFVVSPSRCGKTYGMNILVESTIADIIVFTDANVIFTDDALRHLLRPFGDPSVGCTLGNLRYVSEVRSATSRTGSLYWNMEEKIKELESVTGSVITSDGAIFAIRRSLHKPPPPDVSDDIHISLSILCEGYRVVRVAEAIAYEEATSSADEEYRRKVRIACLAFTVHRMLWPQLQHLSTLTLYKYLSHKLVRWLTIYLLAGAAVFFVAGLAIAAGWVVAVCVVAVGLAVIRALWACQSGPLGQINSILQAFVATGVGVSNSLRGIRFQTWNPPASTRDTINGAQLAAQSTQIGLDV